MRNASHIAVVELAQALRELVANPTLLDGYAQECADAVKMTDEEKAKHEEARGFMANVAQIRDEFHQRETALESLKNSLFERDELLKEKEAAVKAKEAEIVCLDEGLEEKKSALDARENELKIYERDVTNREETVKAAETQLVEDQRAHEEKARKLKEALS